MTALVKLLHLIFKQYAKQIIIKTDMLTVVSENVALFVLVNSYKMKICQVNRAFILIRLIHNFTTIFCFLYWQKNIYIRYI